jgi:hypothetical protein
VNDHDQEPLTQFQDFYHASTRRPGFTEQSFYAQLRAAFYAGYAARPRPPIEPSRDALDDANRYLRAYGERFPQKPRQIIDAPYGEAELAAHKYLAAEPDFIQHGTITGRFPRRDPDKARRMAEAYGIEQVAGPSPETLERIHTKLTQDGVVEYPSDSTNPGFPAVTRSDTQLMPTTPGFEYTETVWEPRYGASGPVPTPLGIEEAENG